MSRSLQDQRPLEAMQSAWKITHVFFITALQRQVPKPYDLSSFKKYFILAPFSGTEVDYVQLSEGRRIPLES